MKAQTLIITFFSIVFFSFVHTTGVDIKNIFILAGQSNMSGRGLLNENYTQFDPSPQIQRFAKNETWEEAKDPLHQDIDDPIKMAGRGPGMPFANALLKNDSQFGVIGLVPCARGDTSLDQWKKGASDGLYDTMISRARAALKNSGGGGAIRALLWFQGEKDTGKYELATMYKSKFEKFVQNVRDDLGIPLLPVIEVALPQKEEDYPNTDVVRKCQFEAAAELQNVRCVDARGCTIELPTVVTPKPVHLTSDGQRQLGMKMAEAFLTINHNNIIN